MTGIPYERNVIQKYGVRVQVLGRLDMLRADVHNAANRVMKMSQHQTKLAKGQGLGWEADVAMWR